MASVRLSGEGRDRRGPDDGRRPRVRALLWLAAGTGLLHVALLGGWQWTWSAPPSTRRAMQVRAVAAAPKVAPQPLNVATADGPVPPGANPVATRRPRPAPPPTRSTLPAVRLAAPAPASVEAASPRVAEALSEPGDDDPPPVYPTRLPPPVTLRYDVTRGLATGDGELRWRRDAEGYALDWESRAGDSGSELRQSSRGSVDTAGIAPTRFVDRRATRAAAAVNFRRDTGRIGFSRKAADSALLPGAQDRLSWLLQLGAIVAADPGLRRPGAEVRMLVAGAGGDVAVWRLRCQGMETVDAGGAPALRFLREPHGPYDTRAEVWLDPTDGRFLPVRANWRSGPNDEGLSLTLREAVPVQE